MKLDIVAGWLSVLNGKGRVNPPDPGNTANPPGDPPVQTGDYQFIQDFAFQGQGHNITDIPTVPLAYQNVGEFALNVADPSGQTGGGYSLNPQTGIVTEGNLYFDTSTGLYYDLNTLAVGE